MNTHHILPVSMLPYRFAVQRVRATGQTVLLALVHDRIAVRDKGEHRCVSDKLVSACLMDDGTEQLTAGSIASPAKRGIS